MSDKLTAEPPLLVTLNLALIVFAEAGEFPLLNCTDKLVLAAKVILADTKQGLFLKAKDAVIEAVEIQAEGAKRMNAKDFLRGNQI